MSIKNRTKTGPFAMAKTKYGKTDVRYWREKVSKRKRNGVSDPNYTGRIQYRKREEKLPLQTPNRDVAASRARDIYETLVREGWEPVLEKWKPSHRSETKSDSPTVGDLLKAYREVSPVRDSSFTAYANAFRLIASRIAGIDSVHKNDAYAGGSAEWRAEVDAVKLSTITPERVQEWKMAALNAASENPAKARAAKTTVNATIRNARAVFAADHLPFLAKKISIPSPLPFEGVKLEKKQSARYRSKIDPQKLLSAAATDLTERPEELKIVLLALMCGLRKAEIDGLQWDAFNFERSVLVIENTEATNLKSEESEAELDLEPEFVARFKAWRDESKGLFVVESRTRTRTPQSFRAAGHFNRLNGWLRAQGITAQKPLHELRKECGAQVCLQSGIYAASRFLRHRDIKTTSDHYLDKKERITPGLGSSLLSSSTVG